MKKLRFIPIMLLLGFVLAFSSFAAGCGKNETLVPDGHVHTFSEEWTIDGEAHYHAATCGHTDLVKDKTYHNLVYGTHAADAKTCAFTGFRCVCGYAVLEDGTEAPRHDFVAHAAQGDGCLSALVAAHETCKLCGYATPHEVTPANGAHTFETDTWSFDANYHYRAALCAHTEENAERELHTFIGGVCTVCGKPDVASRLTFGYTNETAAYEVVGIGEETGTVIEIPSIYEGLPVVGVGAGAFKNNTTITKVVLAQDLQYVGKEAFYGCTALTEVEVRKGVTTIGTAAFAGCESLVSAALPSTLTGISAYAFEGCKNLASFTLPTAVASIGEQAFAYCESITSIKVPSTMAVIYPNTFLGCTSLASVELPENLAEIRLQAFYGCASLTAITLPRQLTFIGESAFEKCGLITVTVPDSVTRIAAYAFRDCTALQTATISKNVVSATDAWFSGCGALTSLSLPFAGAHVDQKTDGNIGVFGFIFGTAPYNGGTPVLQQTESGAKTYYIPQGLASVTLFGGLTTHWEHSVDKGMYTYEIAKNTFENCTMLKSIHISGRINRIGKDAFKNCTSLTEAVFENVNGWQSGGYEIAVSEDAAQNAFELVSGEYSGRLWARH